MAAAAARKLEVAIQRCRATLRCGDSWAAVGPLGAPRRVGHGGPLRQYEAVVGGERGAVEGVNPGGRRHGHAPGSRRLEKPRRREI